MLEVLLLVLKLLVICHEEAGAHGRVVAHLAMQGDVAELPGEAVELAAWCYGGGDALLDQILQGVLLACRRSVKKGE